MKLKELFEALSDIQTKDAYSQTHHGDIKNTNPEYDSLNKSWIIRRDTFLNHYPQAKAMFSASKEKRPYQIRIPIVINANESEILKQDHVYNTIAACESSVKFTVDDYIKGIVNTEITTGGINGIPSQTKIRPVKIVDFLKAEKLDHLIPSYINSPHRAATKTSNYDMIITGHPIDVYGMSTGRGWTSCATMTGKFGEKSTKSFSFSQDADSTVAGIKLGNEINNHTHVVYLVPRGGDVDHDAISRIAFKNFTNISTDKPHLVADLQYGAHLRYFEVAATQIMDELFPIEDGIYAVANGTHVDGPALIHKGVSAFTEKSIRKLEKILANDASALNNTLSKITPNQILQIYKHSEPHISSRLYAEEDATDELKMIAEHLGVLNPPDEPFNLFCTIIYDTFDHMKFWRESKENAELCHRLFETISSSEYELFDSPLLFDIVDKIKRKKLSYPETLDMDIFVSYLFHERLMIDILPETIPPVEDGMMSLVLGFDECLDNKTFSPSVIKKFSKICNTILGTDFIKPLDGWVKFYIDNGDEDLSSDFGLHDSEDWMNYATSILTDFISIDYHNKLSTDDKEWENKLKEKVSPEYYQHIHDQITYNGKQMRLHEITQQKFITYHASPMWKLTKNKRKDIEETDHNIYDILENENVPTKIINELVTFQKTLDDMYKGRLGDNAGATTTQLYCSSQPEAWMDVQSDEIGINYRFGGIYVIESSKPITYNMTPAGMGYELPETLVSFRNINKISGPYIDKTCTKLNTRFQDYVKLYSKPTKEDPGVDMSQEIDILKKLKFKKIKHESDRVLFSCNPYSEIVYNNERIYTTAYLTKFPNGKYTIGYINDTSQIPNSFGISLDKLEKELLQYK